MNYEILAKRLFVRKKFSRSIWKSEVVIINSGAGFVKIDTSNLVEAVLKIFRLVFFATEKTHFLSFSEL